MESREPLRTKRLCCFPIWKKQPRDDIKDKNVPNFSSQDGGTTSRTDNFLEHLHDVSDSRKGTEPRKHSATLTSLDIVVKRNSINGDESSDVAEDTGVHDLDDLEPEATRKESKNTRLRFSPSTDSLYKSEQPSSDDGQRYSTLSYVSSGYGSVKDTANGFLSSEVTSVPPLYEEQTESALGSESPTPTDKFKKPVEAQSSQRKNMAADAADEFHLKHLQTTKENNVLNIASRIEDVLEKRNIKQEDRTRVLIQLPNLSVRFLTSKGGKIVIPGTKVYLYVPPGALPEADEPHLVYVHLKPPSHAEFDNDRRSLTPTVECGPPGLTFEKDVYLTIPHYAVNPDQWEFEGHQTKGHDPKEPMNTLQDAIIVSEFEVTMLLDHFCSHCCSGRPTSDRAVQRKWMRAGVSLHGIEKRNMQMIVQLYDIDNILHESIATESFPITESSSKALVILKGLDDHWRLDEDPIKEVPTEVLWSRCQTDREVSFTFQPKCAGQVVEESTVVTCTIDVFQHNNNHPGTSLIVQKKTISTEDDVEQLKQNEADDIQIKFLLEQDDFAPTTYTGLSNQGFREICMQLENADDCNRGWKALAEVIGFNQYQYIRCLEKRALARNRSPAGMVLDLFFKDSDPGIETLKRLSNCLYKIDSSVAKMIVDREILAVEEASLNKKIYVLNGNGGSKLHASNGSCIKPTCTELEGSVIEDTELNGAMLTKKHSLRTNMLRRKWSSFQLKVDKIKRGFYENDGEGQQQHHEHSNQAFEDEETPKELEKLKEVSNEVTQDGPTEEPSIPRIGIIPCDFQETACDQLKTRHNVLEVMIGEDNDACGDLHDHEKSQLQVRPDSGISSLSGSSRYSGYSCKSVQELTISNFHEEVF